MIQNVSILVAFAAGLLSFVSPCVLPLIPSYLALLGGVGLDTPAESASSSKSHLAAVAVSFILGFSAVFIALSILFSGTVLLLGGISRYINMAAGFIVILLGLNVIFDFLKFLNYEKRARLAGRPKGLAGSFLMGIAFGAGWSPCVGPILGSILLMAGQTGKAGQAVVYLAAYSAGLGLPFLGAALFFDRFLKGAAKLRSHLPLIKRISGVLLIGIGVFILLGRPGIMGTVSPGIAKAETSDYEDIDWDTLPEIDPKLRQAFEELGIPVLDRPIPLFDFSVPLVSGETINLKDFTGKVVFLNFWATWCGPCRMEMPSMEALYRRFKDQGFEILAVDVREGQREVSAFVDELGVSFPAALDARGDIAAVYGIEAFPTTYIIGRDGRIITRLVGAINWDVPELASLLALLLKNI